MKRFFENQLPRSLTGAELYVLLFQVSSVLPLPFLFTVSGYTGLMLRRGVLSYLFDLGLCALPRWEALGLSVLYGKTGSERAVYFTMLVLALLYGLLWKRLRRNEKATFAAAVIAAVLVAADLILRIFTFRTFAVFGLGAQIPAVILRLAGFALLVFDLFRMRRAAAQPPVDG